MTQKVYSEMLSLALSIFAVLLLLYCTRQVGKIT